VRKHQYKVKLDGCIGLNKHNTVFASKSSVAYNRCFPGPTASSTQTASLSLQPFSRGSLGDRLTDRPTYHATRSVTIGGIYVRSSAMWSNNT